MSDATEPAGATPGGDTSGLILTHLTTRAERDAAELDAIERAYKKHIDRARRKKSGTEWLTDEYIRKVHRDMFGSIWAWAGQYRKDNLNIGVEWHRIPVEIQKLCGDFVYWDSNASSMPVIEIAARLQHRLTFIHPFTNGNGRHARLMTDIFLYSRKHPAPKWPQIQLMSQGHEVRNRYIAAMKKADQGEFGELIRFLEGYLKEETEGG
jgi:Fic-DOC domain mobile mystery protein B